MNETLLQLIHRAIRQDRAAHRSLIERYQGLAYALAFRHVHSFPQAQRICMAAWPLAIAKLPGLAEPEGFLDLLSGCVEKAVKQVPALPDSGEDAEGEGHSVLKTEKVQARRWLRQALCACPLPETAVFFLRHVEGLSVEQIAELYGVETGSVVASLRHVCVELAFRAGFAGPTHEPPDFSTLSAERRDALGFSVELTEGSPAYELRQRIERFVMTDADARREDEAVKQVLGLAPRTFAAHRLPQDFMREVLMVLPYPEPARVVSLPVRSSAYGLPPVRPAPRAAADSVADSGVVVALSAAGAVVGLFGLQAVCKQVAAGWLTINVVRKLDASAPSLGLAFFFYAGGMLALLFARPSLSGRHLRLPPVYSAAWGLAAGIFVALLYQLSQDPYLVSMGISGDPVALGLFTPLWAVYVLGLAVVRARLAFLDLERRIELRLRRIEDQTPSHATAGPASSARNLSVPSAATTQAPAPSASPSAT